MGRRIPLKPVATTAVALWPSRVGYTFAITYCTTHTRSVQYQANRKETVRSLTFRGGFRRIQRKAARKHETLLEIGAVPDAGGRMLSQRQFCQIAGYLTPVALTQDILFSEYTEPWLIRHGADLDMFQALAGNFGGSGAELVSASALLGVA